MNSAEYETLDPARLDILAESTPAIISPMAPGKSRSMVMWPQMRSGSWSWPE